jgi:hypothetical protein
MNYNKINFIPTDNNTFINEQCIKWVKKLDECLYICTKSTGCNDYTTHKICKLTMPNSYNMINKQFKYEKE